MSTTGRLCRTLNAVLCLVLLLTALPALAGYQPDPNAPRSDVPENARWNPYHIFPDNDA